MQTIGCLAKSRLEQLQILKLLQCVRQAEYSQIEKMIELGIPDLINYTDPNEGVGVLHLAAAINDEKMLKFLIDLGAHPNVQDLKGCTATMKAAELGHVESVTVLSKTAADMKIKDNEGKGILFYCISSTQRHSLCCDSVVAKGAECNNINKQGIPVLVVACDTAADNEDICLKLIEYGADPNSIHEVTGKTALLAAAGSGSAKVVRAILAAGAEVDRTDKKKLSAAHRAAKGGHFAVLQVLASYGANVTDMDNQGNTPIHHAAQHGFDMCIKYLSQRGCPAKVKNNDGQTARTIAKDLGEKAAMKEARKAEKLDGKTKVEPNFLRLYDWMNENQTEVLEQFQLMDTDEAGTLVRDQFIEIMESSGPTFITHDDLEQIYGQHDKERKGHIDYKEFILGKKYIAKTYLMSAFQPKEKKKKKGKKGGKKKGKTKIPMPICTAPGGLRTDDGGPPPVFIPRLLPITDWSRFDRDNPPIHPVQDDSIWYLSNPEKTYININDAVKLCDIDSLKIAFLNGVSIDQRDKFYKTPLMAACHYGHVKLARYLLEQKADLMAQDNFNWTPLHHACHSGVLEIVEMLLEVGADLNMVTMHKATPLMRAVESSREEVVRFLIDKPMKLMTENSKGQTVLEIAYAWADPRVIKIIEDKFETLPKPKDKKGKGKGKGSAKKSARPKSAPNGCLPPIEQPQFNEDQLTNIFDRNKKDSVLRAASAIAAGHLDHVEDIAYTPRRPWANMPSTRDLLNEKEQLRQQFGYMKDFADYQAPFQDNFMKKATELGGIEEE